jgi:hypothetical protein
MLEKDGWCQVDDRNEVNVSERSCKRSDVPTEFCYASYANSSEFQTQKFRSGGCGPLCPRSRSGPCPPSSHTRTGGSAVDLAPRNAPHPRSRSTSTR